MTGAELVGHWLGGVVTGKELVVVTGGELIEHCVAAVGQGVGHEAVCVWDVPGGEKEIFAAAGLAGRSFDKRHPSA